MRGLTTSLVIVVSLLYPALVYIGRDSVSPPIFVAVVLAIIALRLVTGGTSARWRLALVGAAVGTIAISVLDTALAVKAYPVLMSTGVAAVFGFTLFKPPSLIESIARLREPDLPPEGASYCRKLTMVWVVFLLFNAAVAASTALWSSIELWSLWTGLISYLLMGALFFGEMGIRPFLRSK